MLASILTLWQNQYNLNHTTVPELMRVLLPDLEAIEGVMIEKQKKKLKAKGNARHPTKCLNLGYQIPT